MASSLLSIFAILFFFSVGAELPPSNEGTTESPAIVLAKGRALQSLMMASMRQPDSVARLGEVLPLLRSMTRQQRVVMREMLQNAAMRALTVKQSSENTTTIKPSLGKMLPELNVASLLRRGDEELARETSEAARARALESLELVADTEEIDTRAFSSRNDTQFEDEQPEDLPVAEELRGRRLTPGELLALIAANKRLPQPELVALIGEHHRRMSEPWRRVPSGGRPVNRPMQNGPMRGQQPPQRFTGPLRSPHLPPDPSPGDCDLFSNNLCLEVPNYPREAIMASMQRNPAAVSAMLSHESRLDLGERRQDDTENLVAGDEAGQTLCHTAVKYAKPKRARNVNGRWKFLVNMGSEHTQTMRIEVCNAPGEACHYLAQGVASQCVQLFSHHRLMAWDKEEGLHIDIFKVPTCCSCHVQPAYGPAMFPQADSSHRPRRPTPEEAEPDFTEDDEYYEDPESEVQESSFQKSRVPPQATWNPNNARRPSTSYQPPSPPPAPTKQRIPLAPIHEMSTFPPIFNKDVRKRNRFRNKNRQDSLTDLDDSETVSLPGPIPAGERIVPQRSVPHPVHSVPVINPVIINVSPPPASKINVATNKPMIPIRRPPNGGNSGDHVRGVNRPRPLSSDAEESSSRINYSYHPIIDFFRVDQQQNQQQQQQQQANRRSDKLVSDGNDDWRPIIPSSRVRTG